MCSNDHYDVQSKDSTPLNKDRLTHFPKMFLFKRKVKGHQWAFDIFGCRRQIISIEIKKIQTSTKERRSTSQTETVGSS
jgi:hypothetical protein